MELDLAWTELHAPSRGEVVNLTIGEGTFAKAGQGLMNLVSFEEVWVDAYLTENNLANVSIGDPVEIVLDGSLSGSDLHGGDLRHCGALCPGCVFSTERAGIGEAPRVPRVRK